MPSLFDRYATPFVSGLFLVSLVSGVALFFHVGQAAFRGMHEWLSMVLILPFILHMWKNWRPLLAYFKRAPFWIGSVVSLVAALVFAWPAMTGTTGGGRGGPPPLALLNNLMANPASEMAPLLNTTPEAVLEGLKAAGYTVISADATLADIAKASGKDTFALAGALNALKR
jgi:hypothetical protein